MHARGLRHHQLTPTSVLTLVDHDAPGIAVPSMHAHLAVRLRTLELFAMGPCTRTRRKTLRGGERTVMVRVPFGLQHAVFGAGEALTDQILPLRELWGDATCARLLQRLGDATDEQRLAVLLEQEIAARCDSSGPHVRLVRRAAEHLTTQRVHDVAAALEVSERTLRRLFVARVGLSPKTFSKLARFHRALHEARTSRDVDWAGLAVSAGYYDQAHLIGEFRDIAGVTPVALLDELSA